MASNSKVEYPSDTEFEEEEQQQEQAMPSVRLETFNVNVELT